VKENISVEAGKWRTHSLNETFCSVIRQVLFLRGRQVLPHLGKQRPLYILAGWMKLFAATRSKRKFNNPVSFDEKRHMRGWLTKIKRTGVSFQ
jgi:hypothetical protein